MSKGRYKSCVDTGLGQNRNAVSGAVISNGILNTAVIPRMLDGSVELGSAEAQIRRVFENLRITVEKAGGTVDDYVQIVVYLTDPDAFELMLSVYKEYFCNEPYPSRATIFPAGLAVPGMIIELVAQAHIGDDLALAGT